MTKSTQHYILRTFGLITATLALSACGGAPKPLTGSQTVSAVQNGELPAPFADDSKSNDQAYRIGAFDKLTISVFGLEDLAVKEIQTDVSGRISMPLAGSLEAGGRTPDELEQLIAERLRLAHVRDPKVSVNLVEAASETVSVDGQVSKPGIFPVLARMTLMQAVASGGGVTPDARLDDVVVFRTVNGQRFAALYNLKAIRRGDYADPRIYAHDIVVVGDSPARRLFRDVLQVLPVLTTPIVLALQNSN